ncbi:carbohydrate ABC transporter permease [Virgibacillus salexigens]|uniref:Inner membrane ABC transporter permease protein YcjP n=1 Tax=Virgibacillus massiliensis TaxID=1462526 RepID=A0A024Q838_9BACI|nr:MULTISPECIES: carbohydrate ABC transporter permease [Virgibacillus]MYL40550.1 ABC transporter permease subunit [Virgibacillus massiliensis]CDQ38659.1 Inner membrane ABC transporter permease protein YcjP [Virgibacillus massiliensis]
MKKSNGSQTDTLYKLFIYIALITLAISIIVPVAWVFFASIKQNAEFYGNPWSIPLGFHVENFIEAFQEANMGNYLFNSAVVTVLALAILLIVALPAAYVLSRFSFRGSKMINSFVKVGLFINISYIAVPIFLMLLDWDTVIRTILGEELLLNNRFMLALIYASTALPFTIYLLSSYFQTLPSDFEEAASIDGAGYFKTMFSVMLPMAGPSIIIVILFNFLLFWNEYILALTLMPGENQTLPVGLLNLMAAERAAANYGPMYAGMVIVMLPTLILYIILQKRLTQGMTVGGLKG